MIALRAFIAAFCVFSSITASAQAQDDEFKVPTYEGVYQPQDRDERGLWAMADEDERILRDSDRVIRDPVLNDYVRSLFCRTVGQDRCQNVRIYIVRAPAFNASMMPNGAMRVYSGLLLRMRSEAELASVLGHEFAHFELRHSLNSYRRSRTGTDIAAWAMVIGAAAVNYGTGYNHSRDTQLAVYGGIYNFRRNQERSADILGFSYLAESGFEVSAAADVWRGVMNESDHTATDRGRRSGRYEAVAFFASHPTNLERADTLAALANRVPSGDYRGSASYRSAMEDWIPQFLDDELALNDFGGTDYLISRLANDGYTGDLLFARGELYRGRGHPRDLVNAAEFYRDALELAPDRVESWRGLGLALMRNNEVAQGTDALRTYMELMPEAHDAAMLRMMIGD